MSIHDYYGPAPASLISSAAWRPSIISGSPAISYANIGYARYVGMVAGMPSLVGITRTAVQVV